jgi:hypothetical protein
VFHLLELDVFRVCVHLGYVARTTDNRFNPHSGELAAVGAVVRSQAWGRAAKHELLSLPDSLQNVCSLMRLQGGVREKRIVQPKLQVIPKAMLQPLLTLTQRLEASLSRE